MPHRLTTTFILSTLLAAPIAAQAQAQENSIMQSFHPEKAEAAKPAGEAKGAATDDASTATKTAPAAKEGSASAGAAAH